MKPDRIVFPTADLRPYPWARQRPETAGNCSITVATYKHVRIALEQIDIPRHSSLEPRIESIAQAEITAVERRDLQRRVPIQIGVERRKVLDGVLFTKATRISRLCFCVGAAGEALVSSVNIGA
jgi:hypothetical protein